jgi:TATA-box binding protein (TBP) (component of TFIID and TFIIIB)
MTTKIPTESYSFNEIPKNVSVSTTGVTFELGVNVNLEYVFKLVKLNDILLGMKYKNKIKQTEEINMKVSEKTFNNQLTMKVKIAEDKCVSIKIFLNGSIQIAGSKSIEQINKGIEYLLKMLKKRYYVESLNEEIKLVDSYNFNIKDFKINMINSNFYVNYKINIENLFPLITKKGIKARFEPLSHRCVNIKFCPEGMDPEVNKPISIFVFESGSIIITGARNGSHIKSAYNFINGVLDDNSTIVKRKDIKLYMNV